MSETTNIEWCDSTFNPWIGCTKVGPGCDHCYAEVSTPARTQQVVWGPHGERKRTGLANWKKPIAWNNGALSFEMEHGRRRRVFCASLADVFDNEVDPAWRADLFALVMKTPNLDWLKLTKRIGNVLPMLRSTAALIRGELDAQTERDRGLQAGGVGGIGNRPGGANLAVKEADARSVDGRHQGDSMYEGTGGDQQAGQQLHAGAGDDQREAPLRSSGAAGLPALQGQDSAGDHGEPRGRVEAEQPAEELGTGDLQRAAPPRDQGAGSKAPRRARLDASQDALDGSRGDRHARSASSRRHGEDARGAKQHHTEGGLGHLSRSDLEALLAWVERWINGEAPRNIWLGATIVNREEMLRDGPKLKAVPARVRFWSGEPLLGDLGPIPTQLLPDWVIVGGESGIKARPMHPDWVRTLRDQCATAGVPFLFKQNGEWAHAEAISDDDDRTFPEVWIRRDGSLVPEGDPVDFFGSDAAVYRVGKKAAGRLLDGRTHDGFPEVQR